MKKNTTSLNEALKRSIKKAEKNDTNNIIKFTRELRQECRGKTKEQAIKVLKDKVAKLKEEEIIKENTSEFNEGIVNFQNFILQITDAIEELQTEVKNIREDMKNKKFKWED